MGIEPNKGRRATITHMRPFAMIALLLACSSKESERQPNPPAPAPPTANTPDSKIVFRDSSGRVLTKDDLKDVTGRVDWSIVGGDNVPAEAEALQNQGRIAGSSGEYARAIEAFNKAHDAAPRWPYPLYELAYTYELMGQPATALPIYEQVVKLAPRGFFTALTSVDCLRREAAHEWPSGICKRYQMVEFAEPAKRKAELEAIVAVAPTMAAAWKDLGVATDDDAQRISLFDKALASRPDAETRGIALSNKALALDRLGNHAEAIKLLGELALDPVSPLDVAELSKMALAQITQR